MLAKLPLGMNYSTAGHVFSVNGSQCLLNKVSLKRNPHKTVTYELIDENIVTRGPQEPNLMFPLGVLVQYSLIQ